MDVVTRLSLAVLLGLLLGPEVAGSGCTWIGVALACGLLAVPRYGFAGWRALPCAVAVGLACSRSVPPGPALHGEVSIVGVRVGAPTGRTGDVEVGRWTVPASAWQATRGRVRVRFPDLAPPAGVRLVVHGAATPVRPTLDGAPDPVRAAALARIVTQVRADRFARLDGLVPPSPPPDPTGVLRAIALGDRTALSEQDDRTFRRTGTSHLLSVSGFHVGAAAALATGAALLAFRIVALWRPLGLPPLVPFAIGVAAAWVYAYAAGAPVPALRAAAFLTLVVIGRAFGRGVAPVPLLALVAMVLAVIDPSCPATASYQLTFGAMAGLVLVVPRLARLLPPDLPWLVRWTANALFATIGATLGTLPPIAWWFQELAPLSPVANLVALPLVSVAIVPLSALTCWGPAPLDAIGGALGTPVCRLLLAVLRCCELTPFAPAVGPIGAVLLSVALLAGLRRPFVGALMVVAVLGWRRGTPDHLRLTVLDVGQGDAIFVEHPNGDRWLVDGGPHRGDVLGWLRRHHVRNLDAVVATHADWDHSGGLPAVVAGLAVEEVWAYAPHVELVAAAAQVALPIRAPPAALHPHAGDDTEGNEGSIVLAVGPVLLLADAEREAERRVAVRLVEPLPILKVAHHGSRTSTTPMLLDAARPIVAVVSVGADNRFGHPHPDVLARLSARGILVLRTDRDGTIIIDVLPDGIELRGLRSGAHVVVRGG